MSFGNQIVNVGRFFAGSAPRRFASVSVLLAIVAAIAPTKDLFSQWRKYQGQYRQLIRSRPDSDRLQKRFTAGIQQTKSAEESQSRALVQN